MAKRIQQVIERGHMKRGQVASDTRGVSGRAMVRALAAGETATTMLANLARQGVQW